MMEQNKIFMCSGCGYSLTIEYRDHITSQNQIELALDKRRREYAGLARELTQVRDEDVQKDILLKMNALFELILALRDVKSRGRAPNLSEKSAVREKAAQ